MSRLPRWSSTRLRRASRSGRSMWTAWSRRTERDARAGYKGVASVGGKEEGDIGVLAESVHLVEEGE